MSAAPDTHDSINPPSTPVEELRAQAEEVARLYPAVYRRFAASRQTLPDSDVTPRMLGALQHLKASGPLTASELAQHLALSKATTTELVDRLVTRGLVARMDDERDRRRVYIWLTPAGKARAEAHPRVLGDEVLLAALGRLTGAERDHLIEGLRALVRAGEESER